MGIGVRVALPESVGVPLLVIVTLSVSVIVGVIVIVKVSVAVGLAVAVKDCVVVDVGVSVCVTELGAGWGLVQVSVQTGFAGRRDEGGALQADRATG